MSASSRRTPASAGTPTRSTWISATGRVPVDTGFIVYNERNYPNLCGLFDHLGVATEWSDMSFGFSLGDGAMEWAGDGLDTVFAQRTNLLRPRFVRGVLDILRFNRLAAEHLADGSLAGVSLGAWLERERFSPWLRDCYVLPMGGAIWSTPVGRMLDFPAESFCAFFRNHDLLGAFAERQRWRTVTGGSRGYVERDSRPTRPPRGRGHGRRLDHEGGAACRSCASPTDSEAAFDQVVLACHAPQALALLSRRRRRGARHAGRVPHLAEPRGPALRPRPDAAPAQGLVELEFPVRRSGSRSRRHRAPVTYWMNRLQNIDHARPLFLSLNSPREPDRATIHAEFDYAHPVMDGEAFAAQARMGSIQGRGGVWHAGAWLGYGFHEDGLRAGLNVAAALGARPVLGPRRGRDALRRARRGRRMTDAAPSAHIYDGHVLHMRLIPRRHRFRYRVFCLLLDIDRLDALAAGSRLFSHNRFGIASFHDRDHGPRDGTALRPWVEARLERHDLPKPARVDILCFPRMWGYVFNPLSVYYCRDADGALQALIYEVKNTFGDQVAYVHAAEPGRRRRDPPFATQGDVRLALHRHGSDLPLRSHRARRPARAPDPPGGARGRDADRGDHRAGATRFDDRALLRAVLGHPLMTLKVFAAIHWEALRLTLKGVRVARASTSGAA